MQCYVITIPGMLGSRLCAFHVLCFLASRMNYFTSGSKAIETISNKLVTETYKSVRQYEPLDFLSGLPRYFVTIIKLTYESASYIGTIFWVIVFRRDKTTDRND